MKFSWAPRYTTGSEVLTGCLGIVRAESIRLDRLENKGNYKDYDVFPCLTETTLKLTAHYHTEPPQINFVSVTSFFNPIHPLDDLTRGGILGLDLLKPERDYALHSLIPEIEFKGRKIPIYDLSPVLAVTSAYLNRFPLYPGCKVFEANAEISTLTVIKEVRKYLRKEIRKGQTIRLYSILAIGIPEGEACRLLMEDKDFFIDNEKNRKEVFKRAAQSILVCEEVEQDRGIHVKYQYIYLLPTFSDILKEDKKGQFIERGNLIPTWSQVQFIYGDPPKEIVPPGRSFEDLRKIPFEKWLTELPK